jgi:hypothetical protein
MKIVKHRGQKLFAALAWPALFAFQVLTAQAQGTAFTYQGMLNNGTNPATGSYDLTFALYDAGTGGLQSGPTITNLSVGITNGLFTVTEDFGAVFGGTSYWLQIAVRTNGGSSFNALTPRQELTPVPQAVYAESAGSSALIRDPGTENFFAGSYAGNQTLVGTHNTGVGYGSLGGNTTGDYNTGSGDSALLYNTTGGGNTASGVFALWKNSTGNNNSAFGADALAYNVSGNNNTAVGQAALEDNTSGTNNVSVGASALGNATGDNGIVAIGYQALQNDAFTPGIFGSSASVAIGYQALEQNTAGAFNTAVGYQALYHNTSGLENTATGLNALFANTIGNLNTATGIAALSGNTTGSNNTATGASALQANTSGSYNVAVGGSALQGNAGGTDNTAVGYQALVASSGNGNVAVGITALQANTAGNGNTALGSAALYVTTGNNNIGIGNGGGDNLTSGNNNIDLGSQGASGDSGVIRIGTPGTQTSTFVAGDVGLNGALDIDQTGTYGQNGGSVSSNALTFGTGPGGSGEGIASQRTSGANQFDLALYTGFVARLTILSSGNVGIGTSAPQNTLDVNGTTRTHSIIITGGSDLAEPFSITKSEQPITEGEVVVIDEANPGQLKLTDQPYDTHVAGVVSGANGIHPGIQMQQEGLLAGGRNVALTGRVYVQADTSNGPIKPGDLLTTSSTPGRAMKVSDHLKAQGAILGKAMTSLNDGRGMVLVLVTLQ